MFTLPFPFRFRCACVSVSVLFAFRSCVRFRCHFLLSLLSVLIFASCLFFVFRACVRFRFKSLLVCIFRGSCCSYSSFIVFCHCSCFYVNVCVFMFVAVLLFSSSRFHFRAYSMSAFVFAFIFAVIFVVVVVAVVLSEWYCCLFSFSLFSFRVGFR